MTNRRRIRTLLLNPRYQLKFVLLAGGSALFLAAVNAGIFYHYVRENYSILVDLSPMTDDAKNQLYRELRQIAVNLAVVSGLFATMTAAFALWLTHRTAGPLFRFRRVFDEIRAGHHEARIRLRPSDDFQEVAQSFNQMMDRLQASAPAEADERKVA